MRTLQPYDARDDTRMGKLSSRLEKVEAAMNEHTRADLLGVLEIHFKNAWPDCQSDGINKWEQCFDHGPGCAKIIGRTKEPGRTVILRGPWAGV